METPASLTRACAVATNQIQISTKRIIIVSFYFFPYLFVARVFSAPVYFISIYSVKQRHAFQLQRSYACVNPPRRHGSAANHSARRLRPLRTRTLTRGSNDTLAPPIFINNHNNNYYYYFSLTGLVLTHIYIYILSPCPLRLH